MEVGEGEDHSEAVAAFCAITGATSHVAAYYLDACGFELERSVDFYFQHPPDPQGAAMPPHDDMDEAPQHAHGDDEDPMQHRAAFDLTGEDEQLQRGMAASMNQGAGGGGRLRSRDRSAQPARVEVLDDDDDDELPGAEDDLAAMARLRSQAISASREASGMMEGMANVTRGMMEGRDLPEGFPSMFPGAPMPGNLPWPVGGRERRPVPRPDFQVYRDDDNDEDDDEGGYSGGARGRGGGFGGAGHHGAGEEMELPEGVDASEVEEARMLEAALLGVPYQGRIPDFSNRPARPTGPVDPAVREHRSLRWEQDQAFEESLAADRSKAEAVKKAQLDAETAERTTREAVLAESQRVEREERNLKAALASKQMGLPAEPGTEDPDAINVMVRMPDGSRLSRRFRRADPLQAAFDFVDVQLQGDPFKPGSYSLVNSYPRKVFTDGTAGSLESAGVTAGTAFFLEPIK